VTKWNVVTPSISTDVHLAAFVAMHLAEAFKGSSHSFSCIPPIPKGFSSLCSGRAAKPSSDNIMFSLSLLIAPDYT
jgi:hypothetical protein